MKELSLEENQRMTCLYVTERISRKLSERKLIVHFSIHGEACKLSLENMGLIYFSVCDKKPILLSNNGLKEIDAEMAKHKRITLEGKGHIYLVSDGSHTKIGATTFNPAKRLNELQVGNAKLLTLIGSYNSLRRISTEKMLHDVYSKKHIRGEWFDLTAQDISNILNNRDQFSNNSEYQVLLSSHIDSICSALDVLQDDNEKYRHKVLLRGAYLTSDIDFLSRKIPGNAMGVYRLPHVVSGRLSALETDLFEAA